MNRDQEIEKALQELAELKAGWDSYGGKLISVQAIRVARVIALGKPHIVPRSNGGIQIEWHEAGVDFELGINPDGSAEECYGELK